MGKYKLVYYSMETVKEMDPELNDKLRPEYDLSQLGKGVRGKYAERYQAGTNLVLLAPDVAEEKITTDAEIHDDKHLPSAPF